MLPFDRLSYWEKTTKLEGIDALIVGTGIVGMTTAIYLKKQKPNQKIVLVERGYLPSGASTKNAGFACFGSPTEILDDLTKMEERKVWDTVAMRYEGLKRLFELVNPAIIGYESCGSWDLLREGQEEIEDDRLAYLNQEIARISGEKAVYLEDYKALHEMGFKGFRTAYKNRSEGALNTGELMEQLHARCVSLGIHFLFCTEVLSYEHHGNHFMVETNHGCLRTNQLALCTNGFAATLVDLPVQPARAQVLVTNEIDGLKIKGTFHVDCGYYYFRNLGKRLLLGGGRNLDFSGETTMDLSVTETIQNHLIEALKTNIIPSHSFSIDYQWAGIMGIGTEKHPIITQVSPQLFVAVRMGGMGVALGSMAGLTLSKLMLYGR